MDVRRARATGGGVSLAAALRAAAAEVEDAHGVPVEVVTVGDVPVTDMVGRWWPLPGRRSSTPRSTPAPTGSTCTPRSRAATSRCSSGTGAAASTRRRTPDRHGVRNSIVDRMDRHGGTATVRSAVGEGTEVRLRTTVAAGDRWPDGGEVG